MQGFPRTPPWLNPTSLSGCSRKKATSAATVSRHSMGWSDTWNRAAPQSPRASSPRRMVWLRRDDRKMNIGCVVMAAGDARRFGENKLAALFDGKTLIRRALEAVPSEEFSAVAWTPLTRRRAARNTPRTCAAGPRWSPGLSIPPGRKAADPPRPGGGAVGGIFRCGRCDPVPGGGSSQPVRYLKLK